MKEIRDIDKFNASVEDRFFIGIIFLAFIVFMIAMGWAWCSYFNYNPFYEMFLRIIK